jgi:anti-anti-sigma factor
VVVRVVRIEQSFHDGCVVLGLSGDLDLAAVPRLQRVLRKRLAEKPPAIICDLSGVELLDPLCAAAFTVVWRRAPGWPRTNLLLCRARPAVAEVLHRLRVTSTLALFDTLDEAIDKAGERPPQLEEELELGPIPEATRLARRFVREVCRRWDLDHLSGIVALLGDELVANAVEHAGTRLAVRLQLRGHLLYLAVHDLGTTFPYLRTDHDGEREHGLAIVDWFSLAWGVRGQPSGGKVVWCSLDPLASPRPLRL